MKRGIFLAPFDELADPRLLAGLACDAERAGFDGFFLWDHVAYRAPVQAILDPWIAMAAVAAATQRMLIGPLITPPARRRAGRRGPAAAVRPRRDEPARHRPGAMGSRRRHLVPDRVLHQPRLTEVRAAIAA